MPSDRRRLEKDADQAIDERRDGTAILCAMVGIDLGDRQCAEQLTPHERLKRPYRLPEREACNLAGVLGQRQIREVDRVDVEMYQ